MVKYTLFLVAAVLAGACSPSDGPSAQSASPPTPPAAESEATQTATAPAVVATPLGDVKPTPLRPRVEKRFPLPSPDWLTQAGGAVWVKGDDGFLRRIDPKTNKETAAIEVRAPGEPSCQGVGASEEAVWTCSTGTEVVRVDPATAEVVADLDVGKLSDQGFIPVVADHAWFLTGDGSTLTGVSLATNEVDAEIALGTRCLDLGNDEESVWAACLNDSLVLRVDVAAGEVTARIAGLAKPRTLSVADAVWVSYDEGVARIDAETAEITGAVELFSDGLFATDDAVWARSPQPFLQRLDPDTMELVEVLTAPEEGGSVMEAFGSVWATAYDQTLMYRITPE